jgi:hypothetical protein
MVNVFYSQLPMASARGQRPFARDWLGTTACRSRQSLVSRLPTPGLSQRWMRAASGRGRHAPPRCRGSASPSDPRAPNAQGTESPVLTMRPHFFAPGLSASARYFRLGGAQRPRNVNFSNLGKLLVAEAAGVQRRQRHGNTMIMCAGWRVWVLRMRVCLSRTVHLALGLGCEL